MGEFSNMKESIITKYTDAWHTYYTKIYKLCTYQLNSLPGAAEDCCQEVFFAYWTALKKGQEIQNLQAWLYKVAYHRIKIYQKQAYVCPSPEPLDEASGAQAAVEVDFIEEMLKSRFCDEELLQMVKETLTEEERCIFEGCFLEQRPANEVAEQLGIQINYLYKKKWTLKQKLTQQVHKVLSDAVNALLKK